MAVGAPLLSPGSLPLRGRRAVVTGGGRGIGRSIALAFGQAGADVVVTARTLAELEQVAAQIQEHGVRGLAARCDVTDPEEVAQMAATVIETLGGVDILVNNAGSADSHKFLGHPDELWHRMLSVNLTSVYFVTKAFVPAMVEQGWGRIINIASVAAKTGAPYIAAYTAAKHGVVGLTRALAAELIRHDITVNAICPGYVNTPLTESSIRHIAARTGRTEEQVRQTLEGMNPQRRLIDPQEVAAVALLLAQEISRGITGQAINVDGGAVMW